MKIKNNTPANLSVFAKSTRGSANKKSMVVPGDASLVLDDVEWKEEYAESSAKLLKAGHLEITEGVVLTEEELREAEEAELEAALELVEKAEAAKAEAEAAKAEAEAAKKEAAKK